MDAKPLIEKIEINYFRSIYSGTLKKCAPVNVIAGGNDSGKSNLLRAINLFFNNETDLHQKYEFDQDLSMQRLDQTQKGKTKAFLYVKITFNNIKGYKSLPETFAVKKQWNRYSNVSNPPDISWFPKSIKQNTLQRFLNKIELSYVPAIKGREIFKHYLKMMHDTLITKDVQLSSASNELTRVINKATGDLSEKIKLGINIDSNISVPRNFRDLFGDLDFLTKSESTEKVFLKQRGDGVQVEHIPYILDFISQQNKDKHFIWLYEEPENSLEMKRAFDLANKFLDDFSSRNQIFLTTHSPAFYSLEGEKVSKWEVKKKVNSEQFCTSDIIELKNHKEIDDGLGIAALVTDRAKDVYLENTRLTKRIEEIQENSKPQVLCEGKTDVKYIKKCLSLAGKDSLLKKIEIKEINQDNKGSGVAELLKLLKYKRLDLFKSKILIVLDCDVKQQCSFEQNETIKFFRFQKQDNSPFEKGIENNLSLEVAEAIQCNEGLYNFENHQKSGFKTVTSKELNKEKACNFVCNRNNPDDFVFFNDLIDKIEKLIQ